jgi:hypothetical protein
VGTKESIMRNLTRGLLPALLLASLPLAVNAGVFVGVSVNIAPPVLPVYVQPVIPAPGYIWTPGYWAWGPAGYYWVPGTWVLPPAVGLLWTPGYWAWASGAYLWHAGYWGPHVGFYGGVDYGCGYRGVGYEGGYWRGSRFLYNTTVNNVRNISVTNVYTRALVSGPVSRVSFNGGAGGIAARPSPAQLSAAHERHFAVTSAQRAQESMARTDVALRATVNGGHPPIAATQRPGAFGTHTAPSAAAQHGVPMSTRPAPERLARTSAAVPSVNAARPANPAAARPEGFSGHPVTAVHEPHGGATTSPRLARENTARPAAVSPHAAGAARGPGSYPVSAQAAPHSERPPQAAGAHAPYSSAQRSGGSPGQPQGAQSHPGGHEPHAEHEGRG